MLDPEAVLAGARSTVNFIPDDLVRELLAYGEADAANSLLQLNERDIAAIGVLASRPDRPILDKAICLGIVEFLENQARPLRRNRRRYPKSADADEA
jgi:hypothetical protein